MTTNKQRSSPAGSKADDTAIAVHATETDTKPGKETCPSCGSVNATRFLGLQIASLASVAISTMFGSDFVEPEERKLLAFTDSLQDASHRALFFTSRTHRFNFRTSAADLVKEAEQVSLDGIGEQLWNNQATSNGRYDLVPADLLRDQAFDKSWESDVEPQVVRTLTQRLDFQVTLEFGLRSRVGRTLELSRSCAAEVHLLNEQEIADQVSELHFELDQQQLFELEPDQQHFVRGLVERLRLKGASPTRFSAATWPEVEGHGKFGAEGNKACLHSPQVKVDHRSSLPESSATSPNFSRSTK